MELRGERLVLTSVTIEEAPVLLPAFNVDEQFNQWSGHASGLTLEQVQADMLGTLNQPGGVVWRLADQNGALVGVAKTALLPSPDTGWIDLLVIRRAFQGRGYGAEAATLLETHLFSSPGIRQIALAVLGENTPAMAFWEKRAMCVEDAISTMRVTMPTPIFCLALRPLHDPALRQALLVDSQSMNRLEAANLAILRGRKWCSW